MNNIIEIISDRSFKLTILLSLLYFGIGFAFLHFGLADYGWVFFVLLPYSLGVAVGKMPKQKWTNLGLVIGLMIFILLLLLGGVEGFICVLMSLPIIIPLVWLGIVTNNYLQQKGFINPTNNLKDLTFPLLLILFGAPLEKYFFSGEVEIIEIKTERIYPYSNMEVYNTIKSVDTLDAPKPFLMKLDLPIPEKCILEKEEVGALRTCYFSGGTITERVTELEKGKILRMDVIDYQLTGRDWLGFKEAIYTFDKVGLDSCKMTRITTYTSVLKPRIYWKPLEAIGINQEHQYVLDNLEIDLKKKYQ